MIITHRGKHTNGLIENTIPAFDAALKAGADAVEGDLRLTRDNKVVVNHDNISRLSLRDLGKILTIDELFEYIKQKRVPFFLEVKNSSEFLVESLVNKIAENNLWTRVHIIGFSFSIGTAVRLQERYPKLRVLQLINIPLYSYVRKPTRSYGVFLGWSDEIYGSEWLFRRLIPISRLIKLRNFYEKNGFKVMAGVINNKKGFQYFGNAGITDIVTNNIKEAVSYFKNSKS